jgi:hypothetical protein
MCLFTDDCQLLRGSPTFSTAEVKMTLPNAIIAGSTRCGTTSLFQWLSDHPDVATSRQKETNYLLDSDHPQVRKCANYHTNGIQGYQDLFPTGAAATRVVLEATPQYLYAKTALEVLPSLPGPPRLIFVLRKPGQRVYSAYQFTRNNLADLDRGVSFSRYIQLAKNDRAELSRLAPQNHFMLGNEIRYSRYVEYLSAWLAHYPKERVRALLFEDLKADPKGFVNGICEFLDIDPRFYDRYHFTVKNEMMRIQYQGFHRNVLKVAKYFPWTGLRKILRPLYLGVQYDSAPVPPEDLQTLAELEQEYKEANAQLAELLRIDLSAWD